MPYTVQNVNSVSVSVFHSALSSLCLSRRRMRTAVTWATWRQRRLTGSCWLETLQWESPASCFASARTNSKWTPAQHWVSWTHSVSSNGKERKLYCICGWRNTDNQVILYMQAWISKWRQWLWTENPLYYSCGTQQDKRGVFTLIFFFFFWVLFYLLCSVTWVRLCEGSKEEKQGIFLLISINALMVLSGFAALPSLTSAGRTVCCCCTTSPVRVASSTSGSGWTW